MTVLVDSGILIEVSRGRNASIISKWLELSNSDAAVLYSPISVAELWAGARPAEHNVIAHLFRALTSADRCRFRPPTSARKPTTLCFGHRIANTTR